jgi:predicted phosphodiesterase
MSEVMTKLFPISDIHAEFLNWQLPQSRQRLKNDGEIVIAAGDIGTKGRGPGFLRYAYPNHQIVNVSGNHEYFGSSIDEMDEHLRQECEKQDIHFLQCDSIEIDGTKISGCTFWTDFELLGSGNLERAKTEAERYMNDYRSIYYGGKQKGAINPLDTIRIHQKHLSWILKQQADVIVTHHCPSVQCILEGYKDSLLSSAFASDLEHIVEKCGAKYWICGHSHNAKRFKIGETEVVMNCLGYPLEKIEGFDPALILEV